MRLKITTLAAALVLSMAGSALAAGEGRVDPPETWAGQVNPQTAGCFAYQLQFLVMPPNMGSERDVGGYVFATNMSDEISRFSGKMTSDGKLEGVLTPMHGNAPAGKLQGRMENGRLMVSMPDSKCPMQAPLVNIPLVDSHG